MAEIDILALGEPLVEMVRLPSEDDAPARFQSGVGGDALNALVAAARQGASTGLISAVGHDPFGQDILKFCAHEGIDTSPVLVKPNDPTGVCFIYPDPHDRQFVYARRGSAASLFEADDLPEDRIADARILHVTAVSQAISPGMQAAVTRAAEIARANGTLVSYDLNLRLRLWSLEDARKAIEAFLPWADIVLPSLDEAEVLTGLSQPDAILGTYASRGAGIVALKMGAAGARLLANGDRRTIPAPKVDAIDSAGAGDSFAGAFLAHFIETGDAFHAATKAVKVAAQTVTGLGATDAIPRRA